VRFLITGGTGFVGQAIALAALEAGHAVRVVARDARKAAALFGERPLDVVTASLADPAALAEALAGVDVLVHAAAVYSYARRDAERMVRGNPTLSETVFAAAAAAGTRHVLDVSTAGIFKPHPDGPRKGVTDADSPQWEKTDRQWGDPYLRSKVLAERVAARYRSEGLPISSIHPTNVIGPGDRGPGTSGSILVNLAGDLPVYPYGHSAWVDVRDVAAAALVVAERAPGGRHLLTVGMLPFPEMAAIIDRATGRRRRRIFLSPRLVGASAALNDRLGGRLMPGLPARDALEFIFTLGPVDGSSGLPALGLVHRRLEETVADSLRWWAENRVIPARLAGHLAG
jgi:nucleoside-diphosphate-sugar epimerase